MTFHQLNSGIYENNVILFDDKDEQIQSIKLPF